MNNTRIPELRRDQGWTQEKLSFESGVGLRTVQRLEAGQDASLESLALIANALSVSVTDLFEPAEEMDVTDRLESLDRRVDEQQTARNRVLRSWRMLYVGVGIVVTILSVLLGGAGAAIIIAYWSGGLIAIIALQRIVLEPRLDEKYPLSRQLTRTQRKRGAPVLVEK
ncbi:helix-turn-helix transcriptional regulator [Microbacterium sp. C5A9]|uniref:helix-turn-helix domain-containing protein n=1 Tax=Microbacterium sp. C5A9 TaxID=2736663 RepID=UPI001F52A108|nr:helix-turn-helix transcriptional regulator [Microbacterium sp. C5A9]MCI1018513.1 helix-turn-helix transcriptional regulator [Microbacterium sp. C5A9]